MTTTSTGQAAEQAVADYLEREGYVIVARNWKTRWCEIDIIARKESVIYFVEVKYRARSTWGDGFDYITPKKRKQMQFAAELYCAQHTIEASGIMAAAVDSTGSIDLQEITL